MLHIQRQDRPRLYDLRSRRAEALIPRQLRFEVNERLRFDGSVQTPLDEGQLQTVIDALKQHGIEAVAVGLLHSYANGEHEQAVGRALQAQMPEVTVCLSHDLVQEQSEYERFSTCAMNAFVQPVMQRYLERIETALQQNDVQAPLLVMKSNGGVMSTDAAAQHCVQTILSGPAGGVVAGAAIAEAHTSPNLITADMGGTSFDVAMIHQGKIGFARDAEMAGLAIQVPMLDIHTVGAGGGSIGWIDSGGALRVGPQSAGASPGPACYGLGGTLPTVTDANLVLGRLAPRSLLSGSMQLDLEAAQRAIHDHLAKPLDMEITAAAEGMIRVVNTTMTAAIRKLTVERGHDPRGFVLCPFGGAGPLHGSELAQEMGAAEVLVPTAPGVTSAVGLLMSRLREDRVRTRIGPLQAIDGKELEAVAAELATEACTRLKSAAGDRPLTTARTLGLRYQGQGYDLPVPLPDGSIDTTAASEAFHQEHLRSYGFERRDQTVELVKVWVSVEVDLGGVQLPKQPSSNGTPRPVSQREVYFSGKPRDTPIFTRDSLTAGHTLTGPAIVEQLDSTTVIWPKQPAARR